MIRNTHRRVATKAATAALTALATGFLLAVAPGAASAAPAAGCGSGWELRTIDGAVESIFELSPAAVKPFRQPGSDWWVQTTAAFTDFDAAGNADGHVCTRTNGPNAGQDKTYCASYPGCSDYIISNINENNAVGRLGK